MVMMTKERLQMYNEYTFALFGEKFAGFANGDYIYNRINNMDKTEYNGEMLYETTVNMQYRCQHNIDKERFADYANCIKKIFSLKEK